MKVDVTKLVELSTQAAPEAATHRIDMNNECSRYPAGVIRANNPLSSK